MARSVEKYVVYNLRETYAELGEFEFKVVLNPRFFKNSHDSDMTVVDSDGRLMVFELKKWGRKMNCRFTVNDETADGVALARVVLRDSRGNEIPVQLTWWVIK
jgi:hypothetical protein